MKIPSTYALKPAFQRVTESNRGFLAQGRGDAKWIDVVSLGAVWSDGLDVCSGTGATGLVLYHRVVFAVAHDFECVGWHDGPIARHGNQRRRRFE